MSKLACPLGHTESFTVIHLYDTSVITWQRIDEYRRTVETWETRSRVAGFLRCDTCGLVFQEIDHEKTQDDRGVGVKVHDQYTGAAS